jgi:hypothetical protein
MFVPPLNIFHFHPLTGPTMHSIHPQNQNINRHIKRQIPSLDHLFPLKNPFYHTEKSAQKLYKSLSLRQTFSQISRGITRFQKIITKMFAPFSFHFPPFLLLFVLENKIGCLISKLKKGMVAQLTTKSGPIHWRSKALYLPPSSLHSFHISFLAFLRNRHFR